MWSGMRQQAQARLAGREHHPRDAQDGGAQRVGVDHREQHEPWRIVAAERGRRDQMADDQEGEHRQQFEDAAAEHQRHAPQQGQRRDRGGGAAARSRRSRRAPRRLPPAARRRSAPGGPAPGSGAGRRGAPPTRPRGRPPAPAPGARPCPAGRRAPRGRSPSPAARPTAAARCAPRRSAATASSETWFRKPRRPPAPRRRGCPGRSGTAAGRRGGGAAAWRLRDGLQRA